jgi:hypothetical protein
VCFDNIFIFKRLICSSLKLNIKINMIKIQTKKIDNKFHHFIYIF